MLSKMQELVPEPYGEAAMKTVTKEFLVPARLALMFAFLSIISTTATAVMPLVVVH
jgi:hypothetical protein